MSETNNGTRITVEDIGDVAVVRFLDRPLLNESSIHAVGDELFRLVDEAGRRKLLLDFSAVGAVASAALGKLVHLRERMRQVNGSVVLCNVAKDVRAVFAITRVDTLIRIAPDQSAGLAAF